MEEIKRYRNATLVLAYDLALLSLMADRVRKGRLTGVSYAERTLDRLKGDIPEFLLARKGLGLDGSVEALKPFREDALFDGFSLTGGRFTGSTSEAERVCGAWVGRFSEMPSEDEAARFEFGALALMLSGSAQDLFSKRAQILLGESCEERSLGERGTMRLAKVCPHKKSLWAGILPGKEKEEVGKKETKGGGKKGKVRSHRDRRRRNGNLFS